KRWSLPNGGPERLTLIAQGQVWFPRLRAESELRNIWDQAEGFLTRPISYLEQCTAQASSAPSRPLPATHRLPISIPANKYQLLLPAPLPPRKCQGFIHWKTG
uniref:Uncharacterized protein n=1 Tax=Sus scrofa TaxID=9823 RepID=A0A8D0MGW2_PIG